MSHQRTADPNLIDEKDPQTEASGATPSASGTSGGNLQRDVASRAEEKNAEGSPGIERVRDSDKPEGANLPRCNDS
jgi:hypothetical protein